MSRRQESIPYMLVHDCPWWASVILSGIVYVLLKDVAPQLCNGNNVLGPIMQALPGGGVDGGGNAPGFCGTGPVCADAQGDRPKVAERSSGPACMQCGDCPCCGTAMSCLQRNIGPADCPAGGQCWKGLLGLLAVSGVPWNAISENLTNAPHV